MGILLDSVFKDFKNKADTTIDFIDKEFNAPIAHSEELKNKSKELNQELELLKNTYAAINNIKAFTNMIAGIGQVTSAISSLININNILKNDSLSTGEMILQVITNLAMSIPLLVNGFKTFIDSGKSIIDILQKQVFLTLQKAVADGKEASATLAKIATKEIEAKSEEEMIALRATEQAGQAASIALDGVEGAANLGLATTFGVLAGAI